MEIEIRRSNRKTIELAVTADGVIVRAPFGVPQAQIDQLVQEKAAWIEKSLEEVKKRREECANSNIERLSMEDINKLANQALEVIPQKVAYYAQKIGVTYGRITIRNQKSRWGSCSAKGNLNFNCLLMLTPEKVQDYVVVHELCHRKEMNHSDRFWNEIEKIMPDYREQRNWLKEHGSSIIDRMLE